MSVDDAIKSVLSSVEGKLLDAGYPEAAKDAALLKSVEDALRAKLAPAQAQVAAPPPRPVPPSIADVEIQLGNVALLLKKERDEPQTSEVYCSVFLGAGVHRPPPPYPRRDGSEWQNYPPNERPPVGATLAKELSAQCRFTLKFPAESDTDWLRVSTWHERINLRAGPTGLEGRIKEAVETGKRGSEMLGLIANWPVSTFYTTNYDTHLERALLQQHKEIFVWIYHPRAFGNTVYDLRTHWWRMAPGPTPEAPIFERWEPEVDPHLNGQPPPEPPTDKPVVFKLHGDVRLPGSIVITDDDYITFLRRIAKMELPRRLLLPLSSTLLFLGYSLRDFNMRYVLSMLRAERDGAWGGVPLSFSVDLHPDPLLKATWRDRGGFVDFVEHNLWDIVPEISRRLT